MSRFQDVLPSDSDDSSSSEDETDKAKDPEPSAARKKPGPAIQKKDLEQLGFKGGPSILYVPEPAGTEQQSWGWAKGSKPEAEAEETPEQRQANREAATSGAEASAALAKATQEQRALLRQGAHEERLDLKRKNNQTFQQREKRKRDAGQAKSAKNYVEEEKRLARNAGVYHGFDS